MINSSQEIKGVPDEVKKLLQQVIGNKQTIMSTALARIFTARSESDWIYSNLQGIICMIWDREKNNTPFLRLFDIETFDLLFEVEIFISLTPYFYIFEYMSAFIGIQFSNEVEAKIFNSKVISQSLTSNELEDEQQQTKSQSNQKKKKEKEGLFGFRQKAKKLFRTYFSKDKKDSKIDQSEQYEISRPISVQKITSIQFDYTTNQFDFSNLNDEWKQVFLRAGIQNADLSNEQIAPVIFESVIRFQTHYEQQIEQRQNQQNTLSNKDQKQIQQQTPNIKQQISTISSKNNIITNTPSLQYSNSSLQYNDQIPIAPSLNFPLTSSKINDLKQDSSLKNQNKSAINFVSQNNKLDSSQVMNKSSLLDQIKVGNFQLKHVEVNSKDRKAKLDLSLMDNKTQENLSAYLSKCIAERRKQIRKNHNSSEEEDNDCSDSD